MSTKTPKNFKIMTKMNLSKTALVAKELGKTNTTQICYICVMKIWIRDFVMNINQENNFWLIQKEFVSKIKVICWFTKPYFQNSNVKFVTTFRAMFNFAQTNLVLLYIANHVLLTIFNSKNYVLFVFSYRRWVKKKIIKCSS